MSTDTESGSTRTGESSGSHVPRRSPEERARHHARAIEWMTGFEARDWSAIET